MPPFTSHQSYIISGGKDFNRDLDLPSGNHWFSFSLVKAHVKNKNTFFLSSGYSIKSELFPHIFLTVHKKDKSPI